MISLNTKELIKSLELLYRVVEDRQETESPFIVIQAKNGKLSLTVEREYKLTFSINCVNDRDIAIKVPYIRFFALIQQIKSEQVNLNTIGNLLEINEYLIRFFPEVEKPIASTKKSKSNVFSSFEKINGKFKINGSFLSDAIKKIAFAASTKDTSLVLQAIGLHPEYVCAVDGHRAIQIMIADTVTIHDRPIEFFDFGPMFEIIENTTNIEIVVEENNTKLIGDNWEYARKPEGAYPALNLLIPVYFVGHTTIKRSDLITSIERMMGAFKKGYSSVIEIAAERNQIILKTGSIYDSDRSREIVESATIENGGHTDPLKLAFNAKYLWEALKNLDQDTITINWCTDKIILSEQNTIDDKGNKLNTFPLKNKSLLMPVQLKE